MTLFVSISAIDYIDVAYPGMAHSLPSFLPILMHATCLQLQGRKTKYR